MFFIKLFLASFPIVYAGKIPKKDYGLFGVKYKKGPFRNFLNVPFLHGQKIRANGSRFCYRNNRLAPCNGPQQGMVPIAQVDIYDLRTSYNLNARLRLVKDLDSTPAYVVILAPPECKVHIPMTRPAQDRHFNLLCGQPGVRVLGKSPGVEIYYQVPLKKKHRKIEYVRELHSSGIMVYFPTASGRFNKEGELKRLSNFKIVGAKVIEGLVELGVNGNTLIPINQRISEPDFAPYGGHETEILLGLDGFYTTRIYADNMKVTCLAERSTDIYENDVPCFITARKGYLGPLMMKGTDSRQLLLENVGAYDVGLQGQTIVDEVETE